MMGFNIGNTVRYIREGSSNWGYMEDFNVLSYHMTNGVWFYKLNDNGDGNAFVNENNLILSPTIKPRKYIQKHTIK